MPGRYERKQPSRRKAVVPGLDFGTALNPWQGMPAGSVERWKCGGCGLDVAGAVLLGREYNNDRHYWAVAICPSCSFPAFFADHQHQYPKAKPGDDLKLGDYPKIAALYEEARGAFWSGASTAVVLVCRILIVHAAVEAENLAQEKRAVWKVGKTPTFSQAVDYLDTNRYLAPNAKPWLNHVRKKGNEANHDLEVFTSEVADTILTLTANMLRQVFELPALIPKLD